MSVIASNYKRRSKRRPKKLKKLQRRKKKLMRKKIDWLERMKNIEKMSVNRNGRQQQQPWTG